MVACTTGGARQREIGSTECFPAALGKTNRASCNAVCGAFQKSFLYRITIGPGITNPPMSVK